VRWTLERCNAGLAPPRCPRVWAQTRITGAAHSCVLRRSKTPANKKTNLPAFRCRARPCPSLYQYQRVLFSKPTLSDRSNLRVLQLLALQPSLFLILFPAAWCREFFSSTFEGFPGPAYVKMITAAAGVYIAPAVDSCYSAPRR